MQCATAVATQTSESVLSHKRSLPKGSASPLSTHRRYCTKWLCAYWVSLLCTISSLAGSVACGMNASGG